jgi:hypothetical protein
MLLKVYIRRAKSHILVYIRRAETHILQNMTVCPRANSHILIILLVFAFQNLSKSHFWTNYARIFSHNCIGKKNGRGIIPSISHIFPFTFCSLNTFSHIFPSREGNISLKSCCQQLFEPIYAWIFIFSFMERKILGKVFQCLKKNINSLIMLKKQVVCVILSTSWFLITL